MKKIKVALIATFRPIFQGDMKGVLKTSIEKLSSLSKELDFDFIPFESGMEKIEDAQKVKKQLDKLRVDFILLQNSSFADGSMLIPFLDPLDNKNNENTFLGIWAVPETSDYGPLPLNSICATNLYLSIPNRYIKDYNRPIKWFYGNAWDTDFVSRFKLTVKALKAIKKLRESKILMIGDIAPGFYNLKSDTEKIKKIFNLEIYKIELDEFYDEFYKIQRLNNLDNKVEEIISQTNDVKISKEALRKTAIAEEALQNLIVKYDAKAIGIQCWPNIPQKLGMMICSTVGRLIEKGIPTACEGDIMGALSMIVLESISGKKPILMDLSSWDRKSDSVYAWHCGNVPKTWFNEKGFALENHFNRKEIGAVRNGYLNNYNVTIFRLFENDRSAFIAAGKIYNREKPRYKGVGGWMKDLQINGSSVSSYDFMNTIFVKHVQHHLAYINENIFEELKEFCSWMNIKELETVKYKNYLQLS